MCLFHLCSWRILLGREILFEIYKLANVLPPYRGEEVCMPQWPGELCWRKRKLQVGPTKPDGSKGRGQNKWSPWSSRLGVQVGLRTPPRKNIVLGNHGGSQDPYNRVVPPVNKKNIQIYRQSQYWNWSWEGGLFSYLSLLQWWTVNSLTFWTRHRVN
jgi:hypothetical protein